MEYMSQDIVCHIYHDIPTTKRNMWNYKVESQNYNDYCTKLQLIYTSPCYIKLLLYYITLHYTTLHNLLFFDSYCTYIVNWLVSCMQTYKLCKYNIYVYVCVCARAHMRVSACVCECIRVCKCLNDLACENQAYLQTIFTLLWILIYYNF